MIGFARYARAAYHADEAAALPPNTLRRLTPTPGIRMACSQLIRRPVRPRAAHTLRSEDIYMEDTIEKLSPSDNSNADEVVDENTFYDFDRISTISSWARGVSRVFLGLLVLLIIVDVLAVWRSFSNVRLGIDPWLLIVTSLVPILSAGFFCVLLQAIAEGLYVLLDIEDNTRQAVTLLENHLKQPEHT
jgi:hypothetical protein